MSNKLKQQLITYFLSLTFILTMGNSFEVRNKSYIIAAPEPIMKAGLEHISSEYQRIIYQQPTIKSMTITNSEKITEVSPKIVQAVHKAVNTELVQLEKALSKYEVTSEHINIRTEANAASQIINVINKGDSIEVINAANKPTSNVKSNSGLQKSNIEELLKGTSLAGHDLEKAILEIEADFGINAYFTIAVMKLESGNGRSRIAKDKNNLFGLNALDGDVYNKAFSFKTKGDSVRKFGQLISENYLDKGYTTVEKVSTKYCQANPKWSGVVKGIMKSDYSKL